MKAFAKAPSAGSTLGIGSSRGRFGRAFVAHDAPSDVKGSGALSGHRLIGILSALALLLALAPAPASAVTTHLPLGFSPITGSGSGVTIHSPSGIAVDETSGNVFLNDGSGGNVVDILGAEGGAPASLLPPFTLTGFAFNGQPSGAAVDNSATSPSKGALYVADAEDRKVKKFTRNAGTEQYEAAGELIATPAISSPQGVAVDKNGNVFITDRSNSLVVKFSPTGTQLARIRTSSRSSANLHSPDGILAAASSVAVDNAGNLFVQGNTFKNGEVWEYLANEIEPAVPTSERIEPQLPVNTGVTGATGVAVDTGANRLYIALGSHVNQYDATTLALQHEFGTGTLTTTTRLAVNSASGRIYVADNGTGKKNVAVFGPDVIVPGVTTSAATGVTGFAATLHGTVNPDNVAVTECKFEYGLTTSYGSTAPCAESVPTDLDPHPVSAALSGLEPEKTYHFRLVAKNSAGASASEPDRTFVSGGRVSTEPATAIMDTTATLNGSVNPVGTALTECKFEYGPTTAYGATKPCTPSFDSIPSDSVYHAFGASLTGLAPNATYHFRLVAANTGGPIPPGDDETFTTFGPPQILEQLASGVGQNSATINAKVNPAGFTTTYHFEWGTDTSYGNRLPLEEDPALGSSTTPTLVSASLSGLQPNTTYHFRIVATNTSGTTLGEDYEFTTLNSFGLPDNRGYELVSPADKRPVGFVKRFLALQLPFQVADDGQSIVYPLNNGLPDSTAGGEDRYLASRGEDGWSSTQVSAPSLSPPAREGFAATPSWLRFYSPDLSCGLLESSNPLSEEVSDTDREFGVSNLFRRNSDGTFTLITNVTPDNPRLHGIGNNYYTPAGTSPDCNRIFFKADLISLSEENDNNGYRLIPGASGLYEWDHGTLRDAAILPNGATPVGKVGPGSYIEQEVGSGEEDGTRFNSVSSHGRFFFTATSNEGGDSGKRAVFVRNGPATAAGSGDLSSSTSVNNLVAASGAFAVGQTITGAGIPAGTRIMTLGASTATLSKPATATATGVQLKATEVLDVSLKQGGTSNSLYAHYETATPDGSHVFFLDNYGLTPSSSSGTTQCTAHAGVTLPSGCDLYDFNAETGTLQDLSANADPANPTGASVAGVVDASEDGSYVYFAARGQLVPSQGNTYAQNNSANAANVYLSRDGALSYVATVRENDLDGVVGVAGAEGNSAMLIHLPAGWDANATPDGRHLLFVSRANLTGYDSGGAKEAYRYSADSNTTVCVSCRPDGLPSIADPSDETPLPSTDAQLESALVFPRAISDDGSRIFFTMPDVLAPGAIEGEPNLYEWEQGQVSLLAAGGGVVLEGSSTSGKDVFLLTTSQLDPHDFDFNWDLYDVRVDGGFPPPPPPPFQCDPAADQCQGTATPPSAAPSTASEGVAGPGNPPPVRPCKRGQVRKHGRCVAREHQPKKHHSKKHHKKQAGPKHRAANTNRGGAK